MLVLLLSYCLGIGAALATSAIIGTWLDHAVDWDALGRDMRGSDGMRVRYLVVHAQSAEQANPFMHPPQSARLPEFRAGPAAFRLPHGWRAAA